MATSGARGPALAEDPPEVLPLRAAGRDVAEYVWNPQVALGNSPRPYLHPVRTLAGLVVTEAGPDSHRHQFGISIAAPDIDGSNFWGGRTFVADHGPAWLDNHGSQRHQRWLHHTSGGLAHTLRWVSGDQRDLLHETRSLACRPLSDTAWTLSTRSRLTNVTERPLTIRSPAALGRPGAGYGGFFWRGPAITGTIAILSPLGNGVASVHGRTAAWTAVTCAGGEDGDWTVLFAPADEGTARDRWFVRARDYLGVGSSLTWESPLTLAPGESIERHIAAVIADGAVSAATAAELAATARSAR
ncbi:PmoA family protein [Phytomonospora sp. NPDC050363]|uniref:DUF6807 domain-containing protein n=1 Tax=Phytomonospora sp. NPDC050363 TaxID=3155642 RepID=UPI003408B65F